MSEVEFGHRVPDVKDVPETEIRVCRADADFSSIRPWHHFFEQHPYGARSWGRYFNVLDLVSRLETEHRGGKQGRIADYSRIDSAFLAVRWLLGGGTLYLAHPTQAARSNRRLRAEGGDRNGASASLAKRSSKCAVPTTSDP